MQFNDKVYILGLPEQEAGIREAKKQYERYVGEGCVIRVIRYPSNLNPELLLDRIVFDTLWCDRLVIVLAQKGPIDKDFQVVAEFARQLGKAVQLWVEDPAVVEVVE